MADREKVINALEDYEPYAREFDSLSVYGWVVLDALALLKEQPNIVRCKDCEHGIHLYNDLLGRPLYSCKGVVANLGDWFCAGGRRKEEYDD